jgi:hypothetical protein
MQQTTVHGHCAIAVDVLFWGLAFLQWFSIYWLFIALSRNCHINKRKLATHWQD